MLPKPEKIKAYLKTVNYSTDKYTVAEYLRYVHERFEFPLPPKDIWFDACKGFGWYIYIKDTNIDYKEKDAMGKSRNFYPEHILAREFFKELFENK